MADQCDARRGSAPVCVVKGATTQERRAYLHVLCKRNMKNRAQKRLIPK